MRVLYDYRMFLLLMSVDLKRRWLQAFGGAGELQGAGGVGTLNEQLGQTVEGWDGELLAVFLAWVVET